MTDLNSLADRIEKASGPDREIDRAIQIAVGRAGWPMVKPEPYTASLDAAMTLAEGMVFSLHDCGSEAPYAYITNERGGVAFSAFAKTPALALTSACLRALVMKGGGGE